MFTVLVCGGRNYSDYYYLKGVLNGVYSERRITKIVHGAARGADALAGAWARDNKVEEARYPADWDRDGKAAGPIRNSLMLEKEDVDLVVAFPGGRGTADMIKKAKAKKIKVIMV